MGKFLVGWVLGVLWIVVSSLMVRAFAVVWAGGPFWGRDYLGEFYTMKVGALFVSVNGWCLWSTSLVGGVMLAWVCYVATRQGKKED